jgi:hypothetical protein
MPDSAELCAIASPPHTLTSEQAAAALNEHGFLLQQAVRKRIEGYTENLTELGVRWQLIGYEYPVQAPDGAETTIDLLLRSGSTCLCLECKRPNADYKHWIFFETNPFHSQISNHTFFEASVIKMDGQGRKRNLERLPPTDRPAFQHFLEVTLSEPSAGARIKKRTEPNQKVSRTDGLHNALRQAITATSGLFTKLVASKSVAKAVPVIVTTAQLYECRYSPGTIDSQAGTIAANDVRLTQHGFVAVQYSTPESLALKELSDHERAPGINDFLNSILRTVYIVRVNNINEFLFWAGENLIK